MTAPQNIEILREGAACYGISLTDNQIKQFSQYLDKLNEWNQKINLTAITEERDVVIKHFIDSLTVCQYLPGNTKKLIDVGTGAGFPGIPLKIVHEHLSVTLLDSLEKRVRFLNDVIADNQLTDIQALHGRAEDVAREKAHREAYDIGIARAVASLTVLCEYVLPLVRIGGLFVAMKGSDIHNEIKDAEKAISILGGAIKSINHFTLPFDPMERHIVLIEKTRQTPTQYPRKSGKPTKSPIR
ncbi:MAG: 16S rRNA (guanine(527)-N(7))-methyltransferase RsmG [Clostridiaceae bacterium]|jgi:16S rRNA (guanine527-N7)-methyltransferase|nr:16S rRNA (guanine(527)-N(7))-methyltransferase RsmG [Clostridiaceae bacterium]